MSTAELRVKMADKDNGRGNVRPPTYLEPLPAEVLRPASMYLDIVGDDTTYDEIKDLKKQQVSSELR